jgi:hypothetical protein
MPLVVIAPLAPEFIYVPMGAFIRCFLLGAS